MYDAIVVGTPCAGSPTARLLARKSYEVLLVVAGAPSSTSGGVADACAPQRLKLSPILVEAAVDDQALIGVAVPVRELSAVRADIEASYVKSILEHTPDLAEHLSHGKRESRFVGGAIPGYYCRPYGPGWVLAGDAAYRKNSCTASEITDAFKTADLVADAIDEGLSDRQPIEQAIAAYEKQRNDRETPYFELTIQLATLDPPPGEILQILGALRNNPEQTSRYFGVFAHTAPVDDFFAPEKIGELPS